MDQTPHLVKWATMCSNKKLGGLGIRGLYKLNKALLDKWNWRFDNERNSLWRKTISRKFGERWGGWCSGENMGFFRTCLWKEIRKDWEILYGNTRFLIGDGCRVRFWKDIWCEEEALCMSFPTLFNLDVHKDALVRDVWDYSRVGGGWIPCFIRSLNDWEMREAENFLHMIQPWKGIPSREDKLILKGRKDGNYSIKLMYEMLNRPTSLPLPFPVQFIWNPMVPLKVIFLAWDASWGKALTLDQLKRREDP